MQGSKRNMIKRLGIAALCCFLLCGGIVFLSSQPVMGSELTDLSGLSDSDDPLDAYRAKQKELNGQMDELKEKIKKQNSTIKGYKDEIADLEAQIMVAQGQIDAIQTSIDSANAQIKQAEEDIAAAEVRLAERQEYLGSRLVNLYIYGDIDMVDVIFKTDSFEDFLAVFDMTETIMQQDRYLINSITKERNTIIANKEKMETMRDELVEMTYEYDDLKRDLAAKEKTKASALAEAQQTKEGYQAMLDEFEAASNQVDGMIKEYMSTHNDNISYGGSMIWPLPSPWGKNYVTSEYGYRYHPISGSYSYHTGIDIAADGGTPIYAAADGKIMTRGWIGGYGNTIIINHGDDISTLYGHQSAFGSFGEGDYVVAGDIIGYVGTTGNSTGNHLHFEVRLNGSHTSPWNYL